MPRGDWPARYESRVAAGPGNCWPTWFEWLHADHDGEGGIVLAGTLPDQSALRGVLAALQDLGPTITSMRRIGPHDEA